MMFVTFVLIPLFPMAFRALAHIEKYRTQKNIEVEWGDEIKKAILRRPLNDYFIFL